MIWKYIGQPSADKMMPSESPSRIQSLLILLRWEGRINNARLRELFQLSSIRASEWIREFRDLYPNWLEWDSKRKTYFPTARFFREEGNQKSDRGADPGSLRRYIVLVGLSDNGNDTNDHQVLLSAYPDFWTPDPKVFSTLLLSAQAGMKVEILYRSMKHPEPHKLTLSPHSLVNAGRRWHVRAYSEEHQQFRDFALGRIATAKLQAGHSIDHSRSHDSAWNTMVGVRIGAHPDLTSEQASVIRFEYFHDTASLTQTCRGALVSYFIQDIRAATDVSTQRPPDYQLTVENVNEVKPWLFPN